MEFRHEKIRDNDECHEQETCGICHVCQKPNCTEHALARTPCRTCGIQRVFVSSRATCAHCGATGRHRTA